MIAHKLLQEAGDSVSHVPVVEQFENEYRVKLGQHISFVPDSVVQVAKSVFGNLGMERNCIVSIYECDSRNIVYGFQVRTSGEGTPCLGREQYQGCFTLGLRFYDPETTIRSAESASSGHDAQSEKSTFLSSIGSQVVLILVMAVLLFLFTRNNKRLTKIDEETIHELMIGQYRFDTRHMLLIRDGQSVGLTSKEADLLLLLLDNLNTTVKRQDILKQVWEDEGSYDGRTLDVYISKLRKRLEADPAIKIINVRGVGYKMAIQE